MCINMFKNSIALPSNYTVAEINNLFCEQKKKYAVKKAAASFTEDFTFCFFIFNQSKKN